MVWSYGDKIIARLYAETPVDADFALLDVAPDYDQIPFYAIEQRDSWQHTPVCETKLLEQRKAGCVVVEDEAEQGVHLECGRMGQGVRKKIAADALLPKVLMDIDAEFRRFAVGGTAVKGGKTQPTGDLPTHINHPQWANMRRMIVKPRNAALDGNGLRVGGHLA